jgi:hypothetical protein
MSRDWFAGYVNMVRLPKYRHLSRAGRGALLHVWLLASMQAPEACWQSLAALSEMFVLDGFETSDLDELIALHWVDVEEDGAVVVHDWDEWQIAASRAIKNDWEARRLRQWRRSAKPSPAPSPDRTRHNKTGDRTPYRHVRTVDGDRQSGDSMTKAVGSQETDAKVIASLAERAATWNAAHPNDPVPIKAPLVVIEGGGGDPIAPDLRPSGDSRPRHAELLEPVLVSPDQARLARVSS